MGRIQDKFWQLIKTRIIRITVERIHKQNIKLRGKKNIIIIIKIV